jgi:hypothetical protein
MEHNNSIKRLLDDHDGKVGGKVKILEGIIILTLVFPTRIFGSNIVHNRTKLRYAPVHFHPTVGKLMHD